MQSPVFLVNSRLSLVSATTRGSASIDFTAVAPLLPKLRGQLAEFLNESYPAHLSLLSQPTCVGLGYGQHCSSLEAFLGSRASAASPLTELPIRSQHLGSRLFLRTLPTPLNRVFHPPAPPSFLRHPFGPCVTVSGQECLPVVHQLRLSASP
jgi:hypothetical protein